MLLSKYAVNLPRRTHEVGTMQYAVVRSSSTYSADFPLQLLGISTWAPPDLIHSRIPANCVGA